MLLLDGVSWLCCATACSASAWPNSPSGLLALRPAVGSDVTFCTGGAGYRVLVLVCGIIVYWSKCLHSPGIYVWFLVHRPSLFMHPGQVQVGVSICGYLHSPGIRVCRESYLLWLPLQATQLSYGVGVRCGCVCSIGSGFRSGGSCFRGLPFFLGVGVVLDSGG